MRRRRLLAVASAGGHWVQLRRMQPAFADHDVDWVSTVSGLAYDVPRDGFHVVQDANMWDKLGLIRMAFQMGWLVFRIRPEVVVSTGAAPGFFAVFFGHLLGAKTIWIDSIANADELSLAGRKARRWATHWLTQWPDLAREGGPGYIGAVM